MLQISLISSLLACWSAHAYTYTYTHTHTHTHTHIHAYTHTHTLNILIHYVTHTGRGCHCRIIHTQHGALSHCHTRTEGREVRLQSIIPWYMADIIYHFIFNFMLDEGALVKAASNLGVMFTSRTPSNLTIEVVSF